MRLSVLDSMGKRLASKNISGKDPLGGGQRPQWRNLAVATSDIFETLINHPTINETMAPEIANQMQNIFGDVTKGTFDGEAW